MRVLNKPFKATRSQKKLYESFKDMYSYEFIIEMKDQKNKLENYFMKNSTINFSTLLRVKKMKKKNQNYSWRKG